MFKSIIHKILLYFFCFFSFINCIENEKEEQQLDEIKIPTWEKGGEFNEDSACYFIAEQVNFGPRVPRSNAHEKCGDWLVEKLNSYGFKTTEQTGKVTAFNRAKLPVRNIIGSINANSQKKILLSAHWDSRPFADRDSVRMNEPISGANDGASGVGVLLEIARNLQLDTSFKIGVEIIFFDVEDYGAPNQTGSFFDLQSMNNSWCLGSQYWCYNLTPDYQKPNFGILLDMVGAENAVFPKEEVSRKFAGYHLNKLWKLAEHLGYMNYFQKKIAPPITDDHIYINQIANIPTLDIIHYNVRPYTGRYDFGAFHHTHGDNLSIIHPPTIKAVGQTVLTYLYNF